jgi:hypothetical protein
MALNWNIEKCKDYKKLTTKSEWTVTDTLIWSTMFVGIGTITKTNYKEFYARLHLVELMSGTFTTVDGKPHHLTLADVERRIGLTTNASTTPRSVFLKQKVGRYFKEITESGTEE